MADVARTELKRLRGYLRLGLERARRLPLCAGIAAKENLQLIDMDMKVKATAQWKDDYST